ALKVNKWGEADQIQAAGGKYTIGLAGATANSNSGDRSDYVVGGDPVILVERTDGNVMAAFRSLDDNPVPGQVAEAAAAVSSNSTGSQQRVQTNAKDEKKATATPTPTPKKATPTPTPKK